MNLEKICLALTEDDVVEAFADCLKDVETLEELRHLIIVHAYISLEELF